MVLAVVGTMKAGKSTTINAIVGQEILPNRNRPMTSVPTLIRHVPGKTEPVLHLEHIQPVRNLLITLQEKLATPAGQQVAQTLQQIGDTRVNDRVSSLVSDTARLAHYSADTREQLLTLADQVHHKLNHLEEKLHRVDQVQRAQLHLEQIFSWWSAGRYASFSPAGRCYVALEELRWGAFGDVIRQGKTGQVNQLLDILRHKALTQMAQESGGSATVRLNTLDWLGGQGREQADNEWHDAINWLGDWCSEEQHPVIWSTTQAAEHLPVRMPRLCSAERLSESMVDEIFQKGAA
ncbi:hypothetical protein FBH71_06270 [Escherichia coli]|nr:hypothetical protein [Escherichia coli]